MGRSDRVSTGLGRGIGSTGLGRAIGFGRGSAGRGGNDDTIERDSSKGSADTADWDSSGLGGV